MTSQPLGFAPWPGPHHTHHTAVRFFPVTWLLLRCLFIAGLPLGGVLSRPLEMGGCLKEGIAGGCREAPCSRLVASWATRWRSQVTAGRVSLACPAGHLLFILLQDHVGFVKRKGVSL